MTFTDIKNKVYFLTKTNSTSLPIADLVILANNAMERVASLIMQSDGLWQYDDTNQTDLPIGTTTLTDSQQDYSLSTTHLAIERVEVKDQNGNWSVLQQLDKQEYDGVSLSNAFPSTGLPEYYDVQGSSLLLYPAPNYTQAASLKVYYKRGPSLFDSSDTTKNPGFNSLYHDLIPLWVAYDYAISNGMNTAAAFMVEIQRKEDMLKKDYSLRNKDNPPRLTIKPVAFI